MDVDTGSEMSAAQAPKKVNATSVKMVYQESDSGMENLTWVIK